jgi:hypothetical protein
MYPLPQLIHVVECVIGALEFTSRLNLFHDTFRPVSGCCAHRFLRSFLVTGKLSFSTFAHNGRKVKFLYYSSGRELLFRFLILGSRTLD